MTFTYTVTFDGLGDAALIVVSGTLMAASAHSAARQAVDAAEASWPHPTPPYHVDLHLEAVT